MEKGKRPARPELKLVTIRYLGDYYRYQDGDAGEDVLGRGDTIRVRLTGHWAALVESGHAEVVDRMKVAFVVGHEDFPESPSDTPEAYWRVLVPSRKFGFAVILGHQNAAQRALAADVVWIHQPTCFAAAELAEAAQERGTPVVLDFSEDPWARGEVDRGYSEARLEACERTLAAGSLVVATSAALATSFLPWGEARVVPAVVPLGPEWDPSPPAHPARLAWWSDGRQKRGMEQVAPGLIAGPRADGLLAWTTSSSPITPRS